MALAWSARGAGIDDNFSAHGHAGAAVEEDHRPHRDVRDASGTASTESLSSRGRSRTVLIRLIRR